MAYSLVYKDPNETLPVELDWSVWLGSTTITASTWTAESGVSIASNSFTTTASLGWVTGGTLGETYKISNSVTTASGRITKRTIIVKIVSK